MNQMKFAISSLVTMSEKELAVSTCTAAACTAVTSWLGGWDGNLKALITLMIVDYVTGFLAAFKEKRVNTDVMFWGGVRKGIVLLVLLVAVLLDGMIGNETPIFRAMTIYFYVAREGLSVLENLGMLGVAYPSFIANALEQIQKRGDDKK